MREHTANKIQQNWNRLFTCPGTWSHRTTVTWHNGQTAHQLYFVKAVTSHFGHKAQRSHCTSGENDTTLYCWHVLHLKTTFCVIFKWATDKLWGYRAAMDSAHRVFNSNLFLKIYDHFMMYQIIIFFILVSNDHIVFSFLNFTSRHFMIFLTRYSDLCWCFVEPTSVVLKNMF